MSEDIKVTDRLKERPNQFQNLDWDYDTNGDVVTIENEALLAQAVLKILLTKYGEDGANQLYGSTINTLVGMKNIPEILVPMSERSVREALVRLQKSQFLQLQYQDLTLEEILKLITQVSITATDVESYEISVTVKTAAGTETTTSLTV